MKINVNEFREVEAQVAADPFLTGTQEARGRCLDETAGYVPNPFSVDHEGVDMECLSFDPHTDINYSAESVKRAEQLVLEIVSRRILRHKDVILEDLGGTRASGGELSASVTAVTEPAREAVEVAVVPGPPNLAKFIIALLPGPSREDIVGDYTKHYKQRVRNLDKGYKFFRGEFGKRYADIWYVLMVAKAAMRMIPARLIEWLLKRIGFDVAVK